MASTMLQQEYNNTTHLVSNLQGLCPVTLS
uniref:Uncharacterized protein n=1 Tax=Arundo donax TaxID=35708 RepID=A0A0A9F9Y2_ARUDO